MRKRKANGGKKYLSKIRIILLFCVILVFLCVRIRGDDTPSSFDGSPLAVYEIDLSSIPDYTGAPYVTLSENQPGFREADITTEPFEFYSDLDSLGRCRTACANVGKETMPTGKRGKIGNIRPSGWKTANYHDLIDGQYLYNRCHLIAYQLAGENDNKKNLITGTRYLNTEGMQPFEERIAKYVNATGNHVLYRVTPIFAGNNLVASGVTMEALSVEDGGEGISFHVFAYNVQPGIIIDYLTGDSELSPDVLIEETPSEEALTQVNTQDHQTTGTTADAETTNEALSQSVSDGTYILNTNTYKFHLPSCPSVADMAERSKLYTTESRDEVIAKGYEPCKRCKP